MRGRYEEPPDPQIEIDRGRMKRLVRTRRLCLYLIPWIAFATYIGSLHSIDNGLLTSVFGWGLTAIGIVLVGVQSNLIKKLARQLQLPSRRTLPIIYLVVVIPALSWASYVAHQKSDWGVRPEYHALIRHWQKWVDEETIWKFEGIEYADTNEDGAVDTRRESRLELSIVTTDDDHDGFFDTEVVTYKDDERQVSRAINQKVPRTK